MMPPTMEDSHLHLENLRADDECKYWARELEECAACDSEECRDEEAQNPVKHQINHLLW